MVHDTRVIPLDGRPPLGDDIHLFMGDSRGHWEGDTLVVESRNFTDRTAVGGAAHSEKLRMTERFTRIDPEMIDYEIRVDDPATRSTAVDDADDDHEPARLPDLRVRLPRGQQRDAQRAERRARLRESAGCL